MKSDFHRSFRVRRRAMMTVLAFAAAWPAAHHALARTVHIDPWKLYGWAMYAAPPATVQVRVDRIDGDDHRPLRLFGELARARDTFAKRRASLGRFAKADALARRILESDPAIEEVAVVVRHWGLDAWSGRIVHHESESRHARESED